MNDPMWKQFITVLSEEEAMDFDEGLSPIEIAAAESRYGFRFPPDLSEFLQAGLPCGEGYPDWRSGDEATIRYYLEVPRQCVLQGVLEDGGWLEEWGPRPQSDEETKTLVNQLVDAAPRLIPIVCGASCHMISTEPHLSGNPVFAMRRFDIVYRGIDLRDYLIHEYLIRDSGAIWPMPSTRRRIRFWDADRFLEVYWGRKFT